MSVKKRRNFLLDDNNVGSKTNDNSEGTNDFIINKYRTEQINITRIENDVKSHSQLKKEYVVALNLKSKKAKVNLNDLYYDFKPPVLSKVYEFVSKTEAIRNNVNFTIDKNGKLSKITNKKDIFTNWIAFKNKDIHDLEFIKTLKNKNKSEFYNIVKQGDIQFDVSNKNSELDYQRDLFFLVLFDKHLIFDLKSIPTESYDFKSQLFPQVSVPMKIRYDLIKEDDETMTIRKVAEGEINDELIKKIEEQYNKLHKPMIHYQFSQYKLTYRVRYEVNKITRVINNAELTIIENVENNIESTCKYSLFKL